MSSNKDTIDIKNDHASDVANFSDQISAIQEWQKLVDSQLNSHKEELNRQDIAIEKSLRCCSTNENSINTIIKEYMTINSFNTAYETLDERLRQIQYSAEDINRNLISTDNYVEKYLPIKIHKFVMSTLKNVFDNKKDIRRLRDYEAKKDWVLNEVVRNDDGIPSDYKKKIPTDHHYRMDRAPRLPKRSKRGKPSATKKNSRTDESNSSVGASSFIITPSKSGARKKRKPSAANQSQISSKRSKESRKSVSRVSEGPEKDLPNNERKSNASKRSSNKSNKKQSKNKLEVTKQDARKLSTSQISPKSKRLMTIEAKPENDLPKEISKNTTLEHENKDTEKNNVDKSIRLETKAKEKVPPISITVKNEQSPDNKSLKTIQKIESAEFTQLGVPRSPLNNEEKSDFENSNLLEESQTEEFSHTSHLHDRTEHEDDGDEENEGEDNDDNEDQVSSESEEDIDDYYEMNGRRNTQFTELIKELTVDVKNLKKDSEMLKNGQNYLKALLDDSIKKSVDQMVNKIDSETVEQREYIKSLHLDIDDIVKRNKRDRSDNYIEIRKLANQVKVIDIRSQKTEESVIKSAGLYMGILENIKMHLHLMHQKEKRTIDTKAEEENRIPYVAAEGDLLSREFKNKSAPTTKAEHSTSSNKMLDEQLVKLEQIMNENNQIFEDQLK